MSMNEVDIANFAESMLTEQIETGKPVQFAAAQAPDAPDVSDVEVPDDFTSQILTEGHWDKAEVEVKPSSRPIARKHTPELSEEVQIRKELFEEYRKKLGELDEIVQEMTTVGMMGTGPGMTVSSRIKKKKKRNARTR